MWNAASAIIYPIFMCCIRGRVRHIALIRLRSSGGYLPLRQRRLVEAWAELHRDELQVNWERLQHDEPPIRIASLE